MSVDTCYMCDKPRTSREHVPPRSFFPEDSKLNLITVPSCNEHNLHRSNLDETIRAIISTAYDTDPQASKPVVETFLRSIERFPDRMKIFRNLQPVMLGSKQTGIFEINIDEIISEMDNIARGIHFHEYNLKWSNNLQIFLLGQSIQRVDDPSFNVASRVIGDQTTNFFADINRKGENPEIFYYQFLNSKLGDGKILRMVFYSGMQVIAIFGEFSPEDYI